MKKTISTGLSIISCAGLLSVSSCKSSEDDQGGTKEQFSTEAAEDAKAANKEPGEITENLHENLTKFDGEKYKAYTPEDIPEYYLVYYSASW